MPNKKNKSSEPTEKLTKKVGPFFSNEYFKQIKNKKNAFIEWLALPTEYKEPKTQEHLGRILNISRVSLWKYTKKEGFSDKVTIRRRAFFKQYTSDIIEAIKTKAIEGDPRAQKLFLQVVEEWEETTKQKIERQERREVIFGVLSEGDISRLQNILKTLKPPEIKYQIIPESNEEKNK